MKKYLIIGASGLIGSHLIRNLCHENFIYGLSRNPVNFDNHNFKWLQYDLLKSFSANDLPKDVDVIIYLAQSEYFRDFPNKTLELFNVNVQRYLEILDFAVCNKIQRVIYASSGGVYEQCGKSFSEEDRLSISGELGFYLGSKICSEILSSSFNNVLKVQVLRFFFVYGPGQKSNMLISRLINNIREKKAIKLDGDCGIKINPIHVEDAVSAIKMILEINNSETYNVAGEKIYSLKEICEHIGNILNISPIFEISNNEIKNKEIIGNILKLKKTGWAPKVGIIDGLKTVI